MNPHFVRRAGAVLLVGGLVLASCGDDDAASTADETPTTTTADGSSESTTTEPAESHDDHDAETDDAETDDAGTDSGDAAPDATVLDVSVEGGEVTGGGRHEVALGETVTIRVTSDVADHVHLHGYDVLADVTAGGTAELTFDATIPGVFEVELEDSRIPLLELEIS